jgi:protein-S-isoprenylcysteine O-methyltransferase Ste14
MLPAWQRIALIASAAVLLVVGGLLFVTPAAMAPLWPWDLTPLTSRAVGTWLFAIGFALAHAAHENDYARIAAGAKAYTVFAVLALIALARFPQDVHWDRPGAWLYVLFLVAAVYLGGYGWIASRRLDQSGTLGARATG